MARGKVYNRIYNEQEWNEVCKFNKRLMEDYLLEMKSQKKKESSIKQYRNDLRILFLYIYKELENKPISKLKKKHFRNYSLWLSEECGMSNARVNRLLSALRSLLEYATNEEEWEDEGLEVNYAAKVKSLPREESREIHFLTDEQVEKIYNYLIENEEYQKATFLSIMYDSAGRRNEISQVEKHNILESNMTNKVIGKRGKVFTLIYFDRTKKAAELWLNQRGEDDIDSLWVVGKGENKRQASYESLYVWVMEFCKILEKLEGEYIPFNPHSFRHSALDNLSNGTHYVCRLMAEKKGVEEFKYDIQTLKLMAHHSDLSTTDGYLKDRSDEVLMSSFDLI
ncbi:tyrosine-type recombinase/integrase [Clostridium sp.]|uniref:tyrosine-type recombinase/integrase n=1 Tax=Clostridium sp. TaxID=1506 RepID=UPI002FCBFC3A